MWHLTSCWIRDPHLHVIFKRGAFFRCLSPCVHNKTSDWSLSLLPSLHRRHGQDKTVTYVALSCPCRRCEQNWRQVNTLGDRKFRNGFAQSWNAARTTENSIDRLVTNSVYITDKQDTVVWIIGILRVLLLWLLLHVNIKHDYTK